VTGGTYFRFYLDDGGPPTQESAPEKVSTFRLDKYEVTVGRFRRFVAAWDYGWRPIVGSGKHSHLNGGEGLVDIAASAPDGGPVYETGFTSEDVFRLEGDPLPMGCPSSTGQTWTDDPGPGPNDKKPMNCVTFHQAQAFCIWDGGFLPSFGEFEYAGAGGSEQRQYPWGSADPGTANRYAIFACDFPDGTGVCSGDMVAHIAPVGTATLGAGAWGQLDLSGNVGEWTPDMAGSITGITGSDAGLVLTGFDPCTDCADLTGAWNRRMQVNDFREPEASLHFEQVWFISSVETNAQDSIGFRCARAP
jgi:formylglycine-generating enzyme required for sulfatase activity